MDFLAFSSGFFFTLWHFSKKWVLPSSEDPISPQICTVQKMSSFEVNTEGETCTVMKGGQIIFAG